jgi:hypothetical protein
MKITELIKSAKEILERDGDLDVYVVDSSSGADRAASGLSTSEVTKSYFCELADLPIGTKFAELVQG